MWAYRNRMGKDEIINYRGAIEQAVHELYERNEMVWCIDAQHNLIEKCLFEIENYSTIKESLKTDVDFDKFVMQVLLDIQ